MRHKSARGCCRPCQDQAESDRRVVKPSLSVHAHRRPSALDFLVFGVLKHFGIGMTCIAGLSWAVKGVLRLRNLGQRCCLREKALVRVGFVAELSLPTILRPLACFTASQGAYTGAVAPRLEFEPRGGSSHRSTAVVMARLSAPQSPCAACSLINRTRRRGAPAEARRQLGSGVVATVVRCTLLAAMLVGAFFCPGAS